MARPPNPNATVLAALYRSMLRIRRTEEALAEAYKGQQMRTPTHFGIGQEAVAAGVCAHLGPRDAVYSHHRCHNHYLAMGGDIGALAAELLGRATGCSAGRGGSVHLTARETGFVASSAILGQIAALAAGSALAFAMDSHPAIGVAFFGDAALEEGVIYETLNFAAIHHLPVLLVCENNGYSTESPVRMRQPAGTSLCERVAAFKWRTAEIDGNDIAQVWTRAGEIIADLRQGGGPTFLECRTYRWREHVGPWFDHELDRTYRSRQEVEEWMARCPVEAGARALLAMGGASAAELEEWNTRAGDEVAAAISWAMAQPWPDSRELLHHVG